MSINFPPGVSGATHSEAGINWTYDGEKWVSQSDASLWERNGTTLEPANDGDSVEVKGYLNVSSYCNFNYDGVSPERVSVGNYGIAGNPTALLGYNASDVTKFVLNAVDGSATFAGGNCDINNDGLLRVKRSAPNGSGGLVIYPDNDFSKDAVTNLKTDGSATFAGGITVNAATYGPISVNSSAQYGQGFYTNATGSTIGTDTAYAAALNGSINWSVNYNGSSTFRNTTFNLEPDNPANYTTTTDADGNETRVYNGPTLDVKERILNLISRLDAIEANEQIDDATDTSLLQLVANASTRLDSIEARLTALEGGN